MARKVNSVVQSLIGDDALELRVLALELLEALHLLAFHAAELVPPAVVGRIAHFELASDVCDRNALCERHVGVAELANDLFGCVSFTGHEIVHDAPKGAVDDSHSGRIIFPGSGQIGSETELRWLPLAAQAKSRTSQPAVNSSDAPARVSFQ